MTPVSLFIWSISFRAQVDRRAPIEGPRSYGPMLHGGARLLLPDVRGEGERLPAHGGAA